MNIPSLSLYKKSYTSEAIDIEHTLKMQMDLLVKNVELNRKKIVIAVGSRHIKDQVNVLLVLIDILVKRGAEVTIIPAMGSHGGSTADGQREVLAINGIDEKTMGVPIVSSHIPKEILLDYPLFPIKENVTLYIDSHVLTSDYVILLNRIKPHTSFTGPIQSGLCKMACIGLGKPKGARIYHRLFNAYTFESILPILTQEIQKKVPFLAGIALIEDEGGNVTSLSVLPPHQWILKEPELLQLAVSHMPYIPIKSADILIVEEFGKSISGSGLDTNIIGLKTDFFKFEVNHRYIRSMAKGSGGNAVGMGLSDVMHKKVLEDVDFSVSYINAETSLSPNSVKIPMTYPTDKEAIASLYRMGGYEASDASIVWIQNTSNLTYILTNCPINNNSYHLIDSGIVVEYDKEGNLPTFEEILSFTS